MSQTMTFSGSFQRSERPRDNSNSFMAMGIPSGLQPSTLGFVAKQEMPLHLSILFRARYAVQC